MAEIYIAKDGEMLDYICWKYYTAAQLPLAVERVLAANRGIAATGLRLKAGSESFSPNCQNLKRSPSSEFGIEL